DENPTDQGENRATSVAQRVTGRQGQHDGAHDHRGRDDQAGDQRGVEATTGPRLGEIAEVELRGEAEAAGPFSRRAQRQPQDRDERIQRDDRAGDEDRVGTDSLTASSSHESPRSRSSSPMIPTTTRIRRVSRTPIAAADPTSRDWNAAW